MGERSYTTAIVLTIVVCAIYAVMSYMSARPKPAKPEGPRPAPPAAVPTRAESAQTPTPAAVQPTRKRPEPKTQEPFSVDGNEPLRTMVAEAVRSCPAWKDCIDKRHGKDPRAGQLLKFKVSGTRETDKTAAYAEGSHLPGKVTVSLMIFETGKAALIFQGSADRELPTSLRPSRRMRNRQEQAFHQAEREAIGDLVYEAAFTTLMKEGSAEVIERIGMAIESRNPSARRAAMRALSGLESKAKPAAASLARALESREEDVTRTAADLLVKIGPSAVAAVVEQLSSRYSRVVKKAMEVLGEMGPDAADAVPALIKNVEKYEYASQAGEVLAKIGKPAVGPLTDMLKSRSQDTRRRAAEILGDIGYHARSAVPALQEMMNDKRNNYSTTRKAAEDARTKILNARPAGRYKIRKIE